MNNIFEIFNIILINPMINLLVAFYQILHFVGVPYAFGFSIIALTIFIRIILLPFTSAQIKSAHKMQKIAPHLSRVREVHKGDNKRQQAEIMKLYKEHDVNPAAGCLPLLIQFPIIWSLYHVLNLAVNTSKAADLAKINDVLYFSYLKLNVIWNTTFFGLPLGSSPSKLIAVAPLIVLVPVLTGVLQFILSKMMMPEESLVPAVTTKKKEDDFQAAFQKQSLFIFPVMIGFFSFSLPLGLSLYWNSFTLFGIIQQYLLLGPGSAGPWIKKIKNRNTSAPATAVVKTKKR